MHSITKSWEEISKALGFEDTFVDAFKRKTVSRPNIGRADNLSKVQDIDITRPWWEIPNVSGFGNVGLDTNWAQYALELMALKGAPPRLYTYKDGSPKESLEIVLVKLQDAGVRLVSKTQYDDKTCVMQFANETSCVEVKYNGDSRLEIAVETNSQEFFDKIRSIINDDMTSKPPAGRVHVMVSTQYGPEFEGMGIGGHELVRGNYTDDVLVAYDKIIQDLKSSDPTGRLSIFNGPPGTGKTYLIRAILQAADNSICVVVPAAMLQELSSPSIIPSLIELRKNKGKNVPIVFLVEDADECLVSREDANMSSISAVLNLCDGILGSLLDIRVIATTNAERMQLDKALIRPGRLSANVEVQALPFEKAKEVATRLGVELSSEGKYTLAELYNLAKGGNVTATGIKVSTKGKMGF